MKPLKRYDPQDKCYDGENYATHCIRLYLANDPKSNEEIYSYRHTPWSDRGELFRTLCWAIWPTGYTPDGIYLTDVDFDALWDLSEP